MYKIARFVAALLLTSFSAHAQDWARMMKDPNVSIQDLHSAFERWQTRYGSVSTSNEKPESEGNMESYQNWEKQMLLRTDANGTRQNPVALSNEYLKNWKKNKKLSSPTTLAGAAWTYDGLPAFNNNMTGNGRVNHITVYPGNDSILFACTPAGGLWKTTDGGTSWITNTDQLPVLSTTDLAIDPVHPNIMYLATGDGDGYDGTTIGLLKSIDGGQTWDTTGLYYTLQNSGPNYIELTRILISPARDSSLYCGTSQGLYYSADAGLTWTRLLNAWIRSVEFEPGHPATLFAGDYSGNFYRCTDGMTFTHITSGLPSIAGRMGIGVSPADSNIVYVAAVDPNSGAYIGLYRSADRGQNFTLQSSHPNILGWTQFGTDATGQGWYDLCVTVSPTNTDSVYIAGPDIWLSADKGQNWTNLTYNLIHVDNHHLCFAPGSNRKMFLAEDGGVYKSNDAGKTWTNISSNLAIGEEYNIGLSADKPEYFITGWQDNGTNLDSNGIWKYTTSGDGLGCFIDYTSDNTLYAASYLGGYSMTGNAGNIWNPIDNGITESQNGTGPFFQDPQIPSALFAGIKNVWEFGGNNWIKISKWGNNTITALAVAPSNNLFIYAAEQTTAYKDSVYATKDGGGTWKNISTGLPITSGSISSIVVDPVNPLRVWVSFGSYNASSKVFQSTDGGLIWTNISAGLPALPVNCMVYQGGTADGIYAGTDIGVYYRDTVTAAWMNYNTGLPNVKINDLKIYAPGNMLYAATYGRGTWKTPTLIPASVAEHGNAPDLHIYPNPTAGVVTLNLSHAEAGPYTLLISNLCGQCLYKSVRNLNGNYSETLDLEKFGPGIYFLTVSGSKSGSVTKVVVY
ncbi:MAG: T9SS type A sorting domain-containing protein [Bacteroidia bacterium]